MSKVIAVIPSRLGSTRLAEKPLAKIEGKSMVLHVWERAKQAKLVDRVIVATDNQMIFDEVVNAGGEAVMTSPDCQSGTDRICEAVRDMECEIVVNVQGDEPLIEPSNIDKAITPLLEDSSLNMSTLAVKMTEGISDHNKVKVVLDVMGYALYFSRSPIPYNMSGKAEYLKHLGLYGYRKNLLMKFPSLPASMLEESERLEQLRVLESGEKIKVVLTDKDSIAVDTAEDLELVRQLIAEANKSH